MDSASALIRAHIEALPESIRLLRWAPTNMEGCGDVLAGQYEVCVCHPAEGAYIAGMDPTVGAALADLLDAIREQRRVDTDDSTYRAWVALEAAILRTERTDQ